MATLEKRVQVLFDPEVYALLEAEAAAERMSVGALIRESVEQRLSMRRMTAEQALMRLFASGDEHPSPGIIDYEEEKDLNERAFLEHIR